MRECKQNWLGETRWSPTEKTELVEKKADAVAGHKHASAHDIVNQVNDDLKNMTLEQRQGFFYRLSEDATKAPNHDLLVKRCQRNMQKLFSTDRE